MDSKRLEQLKDSLTGEFINRDELDRLGNDSQQLIEDCGHDTTIKGVPAKVTPYAHEFTLGEETYHIRLAQFSRTKSKKIKDDKVYLVFDTSQDPDRVVCQNPYALYLHHTSTGFSLINNNGGTEPIIDDPSFVELAEQVVTDISGQAEQHRVVRKNLGERALAWAQGPRQKLRNYFRDDTYRYRKEWLSGHNSVADHSRGRNRRLALVSGVVGLALSYSHVPFENVDAKIGPIPVPAPIEWVVDWNNHPDHMAQAFPRPEEDLAPYAQTRSATVPMDTRYPADGAPRARYGSHMTARKGLYSVNLSDTEIMVRRGDTALNSLDASGVIIGTDNAVCTNISGSFASPSNTEVFTQDTDVHNKARVTALNSHTLQICPVDLKKPFKVGDRLYIWHK